MTLGLFKDKTARVDDGENLSPIPQRSMSLSQNEAFGKHVVINEGIATPDMEAWYIDIDEDTGQASQLSQREIMLELARRNKSARAAFFRGDEEGRKEAMKEEDLPAWVIPATNSLNGHNSDPGQFHLEHMQDNMFRAAQKYEGGGRHVWIIEARRNGDLALVSKLEETERFADLEWETRSTGNAKLSPPTFDENPDKEELDREMVAADVQDFTRDVESEDDLSDDILKEFLKGAYREYDLGDEAYYEVQYVNGFFRIKVNDGEAYVYNFLDYNKISEYFGIPEWSQHILWEDLTHDRVPFNDEGEQ